jgi:uncharacterized membrane protein YhiD involved in acid resistance
MPDFLQGAIVPDPPVHPLDVVIRLILALVLGAIVSWIYKRARLANEITSSFPPTLVLLSVLIAMVTQVVGNSPARAFALVGALSIVRFRTVVRDTQDTAYVIFSVVVGMSMGAGNLWVAGIGMVVVGVAAFLMKGRTVAVENGLEQLPLPFILRIRVGLGADFQQLIGPTLDAHLSERRLRSMETAKQGISVDVTYDASLKSPGSAEALVKTLNKLEGVQDVRLERREFGE